MSVLRCCPYYTSNQRLLKHTTSLNNKCRMCLKPKSVITTFMKRTKPIISQYPFIDYKNYFRYFNLSHVTAVTFYSSVIIYTKTLIKFIVLHNNSLLFVLVTFIRLLKTKHTKIGFSVRAFFMSLFGANVMGSNPGGDAIFKCLLNK